MWETAEKGFGITIGFFDMFACQRFEWADLNMFGAYDIFGDPLYPLKEEDIKDIDLAVATDKEKSKYYKYQQIVNKTTKYFHGDNCSSFCSGRGGNTIYGYAPNACLLLVEGMYFTNVTTGRDCNKDNLVTMLNLSIDKNPDIMSSSWGRSLNNTPTDSQTDKESRKRICEYGNSKGLFFEAAFNEGDGDDFSPEAFDRLTFGDYDETLHSGIILVSNCFSNLVNNASSNSIVPDNI